MEKKIIVLITVALVLYIAPSILYGYYYTESEAIQKLLPQKNGNIVFEKSFGNNKVIITKTNGMTYVNLIECKWGLFYKGKDITPFSAGEPGDLIRRTWSASLTEEQRYDTVLAVEVLDPSITKVIISNEGYSRNLDNLEDVKALSALFLELDVINGFAVTYTDLSIEDAGSFVFRGLNDKGEVVSVN